MADWFEITEDDVKRPHVLYDPTCLLVDAVADAALETITHASFQVINPLPYTFYYVNHFL